MLFDNQEVETFPMEPGTILTVVAVDLIVLAILAAAIYWVLKRRNEDLISSAERTAREILKKAAAFFAKENT